MSDDLRQALDGAMAEAMAPVKRVREQAITRLEELEEERTQLKGVLRAANKTLRDAGVPQGPRRPGGQGEKRSRQGGKAPMVSEDALNRVRAAIDEIAPEPFMAKTLADKAGVSRYQAYESIKVLRNSNEIRKAGKIQPPGSRRSWDGYKKVQD